MLPSPNSYIFIRQTAPLDSEILDQYHLICSLCDPTFDKILYLCDQQLICDMKNRFTIA